MKKIMALNSARALFYVDNPGLGANHLLLLEILAIYDNIDFNLSVQLAMRCKSVGSPATIHRMLDALIENDLIQHKYDNGNVKTKYLHLTAKSKRYFKRLEKEIERMQ